MDNKILSQVIKQVYQKYPDLRGITPQVRELESNGTNERKYSVVFKTSAISSNQKTITKYVRATVNDQGKILRISSSR